MSDFQQPLPLETIKEKYRRYMLPNYSPANVAFYFGQGELLYDTENKQYIDFLSGISVTNLGHGEADIVEAIREQAERILHSSNLFYNQEQALLAEALIQHSFPGRVFFCNSGTEANEAAFKLARSHGQKRKGGASEFAVLENSFHGRTMASMSLTAQSKVQSGFGPLLEGIHRIVPNDKEGLEKLFEERGPSLCGMIIELIQGEAGIRPLDLAFVKLVRELCTEHAVLLIVDEIQTGFGRTGKLFCYEHAGILPDAMTLAKALANGLPMGALVVALGHEELLTGGMHGSTFGGNHLVARVAYETLRIIVGRDLISHANALSEYFFRRLRLIQAELPELIKEVRGLGLHIGVELSRPGKEIVGACLTQGLVLNCTAEKVLRIMPPLNLSLENADTGLSILERVFKDQPT
ncbi:MAG: aspartate aminotransferase family protein [Spirochaetales bacterium]|nr:aspartate aminotransferase family protein [Spirochaetales bacterium]